MLIAVTTRYTLRITRKKRGKNIFSEKKNRFTKQAELELFSQQTNPFEMFLCFTNSFSLLWENYLHVDMGGIWASLNFVFFEEICLFSKYLWVSYRCQVGKVLLQFVIHVAWSCYGLREDSCQIPRIFMLNKNLPKLWICSLALSRWVVYASFKNFYFRTL